MLLTDETWGEHRAKEKHQGQYLHQFYVLYDFSKYHQLEDKDQEDADKLSCWAGVDQDHEGIEHALDVI